MVVVVPVVITVEIVVVYATDVIDAPIVGNAAVILLLATLVWILLTKTK